MRIAFYAPMKAPDHPVPSGDRQMARLLMRALAMAGHDVAVMSGLRSYSGAPDAEHYGRIRGEASNERERIGALWRRTAAPDLIFCYHPYYKSPDTLGPSLAAEFGIPYVTAEASHSHRRDIGAWRETQASVVEAIRAAAVNICMTARDRAGLREIAPTARLADLPPFVDVAPFSTGPAAGRGHRLITVAMMRSGDKMASYMMLARALQRLGELDWSLAIVGDGPCRAEVEQAFRAVSAGRIEWLGELAPASVVAALGEASVFVWPGCGEAYGLAYLEAQAAGLPVVAQAAAGIPAVVRDGETGLLSAEGDIDAFAAAIRRLLLDAEERDRMGKAARRFVLGERSLEAASARLGDILTEAMR